MGMGKIISNDWQTTPSGLLIPAYPRFFERNQKTAWLRYFEDRARVYEWAKSQHWEPGEDGRVYMAMDIETDDPHIEDFGPGALRNLGEILGVGVYCPQLKVHGYLDPEDRRIGEWLADPKVTVIFHNAVYDLDWLHNWSRSPAYHNIKARIEDTMTRQSLIDTYSPSFKLDWCCKVYGLEGKNKEETLEKWWEENRERSGLKGKLMKNLKHLPRQIVGKYCMQDAKATYELFCAQQPVLEKEELVVANDIECRLYPWLLDTRSRGIRVDNVAREKLSEDVTKECREYEVDFYKRYGDVNLNSNKQLQELWTRLGLPFEYSKSGSPSFGYDQLLEFKNGGDQLHMNEAQLKVAHDVATDILQIREYRKLLDTFVDGQFVDMQYNGRIYTCLYPAKRDGSGGTVTGRFSSANPNLQQVPAHSEWGKQTRSIFIPEDDCWLGAFDYKQIEYRLFTHFAQGEEGKAAQKLYHDDPSLDYHEMGQKMMGWWYPEDEWANKEARHMMKRLSFGNLYGLKARTFSEHFKWDLLKSHPNVKQSDLYQLAQDLQTQYQEKVPFIKVTNDAIMKVGQKRGYVKTLSGKRQRMPPNPSKGGDDAYKLINYLVQGSAGDVFKKGVCVDAWEAGVFDVLKSHLMVHDELVFSIPKTKAGYEACIELKNCMASAYPLKVPLGVDTEIGTDWGHCNGKTWREFEEEMSA